MKQEHISAISWSPFFPGKDKTCGRRGFWSRRLSPHSVLVEKVAHVYEHCVIVVPYECLKLASLLLGWNKRWPSVKRWFESCDCMLDTGLGFVAFNPFICWTQAAIRTAWTFLLYVACRLFCVLSNRCYMYNSIIWLGGKRLKIV